MNDVDAYRARLLARILQIAASGSVGLGALANAQCGSRSDLGDAEPITDSRSGSSTASGGGAATSGAGALVGAGGGLVLSGDGSDGGAPYTTLLDAGPGDGGTELLRVCVPPGAGGVCPPAAQASGLVSARLACDSVVAIAAGPTMEPGLCCYDVEALPFPCYVGRTFFLDDGVVKAQLRKGRTWRAGSVPVTSGINERTRRALAEAWARDGLFEHASVASFSRFTMQLLALGAPADLVRDTQLANVDEVKHAELCLGLASAYAGEPVEPTGLPFPAAIVVEADLAAIAAESAMEACIGETVATVQAMEALAHTTDPAVREVLRVTVEDEARHAELGWRFLAWALDNGGEATRQAVIRSFASFCPPAPTTEDLDGVDRAIYAAHGRQVASEGRAIAARVLREIVQPAVCALLARRTQAPRADVDAAMAAEEQRSCSFVA